MARNARWRDPRWLVGLMVGVTLVFLWAGGGPGRFHPLDLAVFFLAVVLGGAVSWWGASRRRAWAPGEAGEDPLWDGSLASIVFGALVCSLVTGVVATSGPRVDPVRGGAMLLHLVLLPAMLVPMTLYTVRHASRERPALRAGRWNAFAGIALVVMWGAAVVSGTVGLPFGRHRVPVDLHRVHSICAAAVALLCVFHLAKAVANRRRVRALVIRGGAAALVCAAVASLGARVLEPRLPWIQADDVYGAQAPLQRAPMQARTSARTFLNRSMSCADPQGCHAGISAQWRVSAHGQAGKDPLYQKVRGIMERELGRETARDACDICHAPVRHAGLNVPESEDHGVGCLHCHSLPALDRPEHMGLELVDPPPGFLLEDVRNPLVSRLSYLVVLASGAEHKGHWEDRGPGAAATCGVCHEDRVGDEDQLFQDNFSTWEHSPFGPGGASERSCISCHMPLEGARDLASSEKGEVFSHRFATANLWLGELTGDATQVARIRDYMESAGFGLEVSAVAGSLQVGLFTESVGHVFPGGVADLARSEVIAEVRVPGSTEWRLLRAPDRARCAPETDGAVRVGVTIRDRQGDDLVKHEVWRVLGKRRECARVPPDRPRYVNFAIPADVPAQSVFRVRWTYRSIPQELTEWAVPGSISPQVVLAEEEWSASTQG